MTVAQFFGLAYGPCAITYPGNLTDDDQPNQNLVKKHGDLTTLSLFRGTTFGDASK